MTIATEATPATYAGDGVSTVFAVPFYFLNDSDLVVTRTSALGVATTLGLNVDYTLTGAGVEAGGSLTKTTALLAGETMGIVVDPPITQTAHFVANQPFPSVAVERGFDKLTQITQRVRSLVDRGMYAPDSDVNPLVQLPPAADRANKYPTFDSSGNLEMASVAPIGTLTSSIIATTLNYNKQTAAESAASVTPTDYSYPPGDVRRYGAVLDGSTDDTAAINRWLSIGGLLTFPVVKTAKVTSAVTPVSNTTILACRGATIRQYTANANVMAATSKTNILVRGLTFYAVGSMSSTFNGQGFFSSGCTDVVVEDCVVKNHRGFGIMHYNFTRCEIRYCIALLSPVIDSDTHDNVGGDFALEGNGTSGKLLYNYAASGNGVGCQAQSLLSTDVMKDVMIHGNTIRDCRMYGVNVYNFDTAGVLKHVRVTENNIDNITGAVKQATLGYIFGSGVYCVAADRVTVAKNHISGTHAAAVTWVDLLAPGAIGATLCGVIDIEGNDIEDAGYFGITVRDPGVPLFAQNGTKVRGNTVRDVVKCGIQVKEKANISVKGNWVETCLENGIDVVNTTTQRSRVSVVDNDVVNTTLIAIHATYLKNAQIRGNRIDNADVHGIYVENAANIGIDGNSVVNHETYGIYIDSTVSGYTCGDNYVDGNEDGAGNATFGISFNALGNLAQDNIVEGCATLMNGTYNPRPASTPVAGAWVAGNTVMLSAPSAGGKIGATITTAGTIGSGGVFKAFGAIDS